VFQRLYCRAQCIEVFFLHQSPGCPITGEQVPSLRPMRTPSIGK
jgi:hypothetical protein